MDNLNNYYVMQNKNLLISLSDNRTTLKNGISIAETRGRKDIICGIVEASHPSLKIPSRALAWFPQYSGLPIQLEAKTFLIVNFEDVVMIENINQE